jgi:hypothetical protein
MDLADRAGRAVVSNPATTRAIAEAKVKTVLRPPYGHRAGVRRGPPIMKSSSQSGRHRRRRVGLLDPPISNRISQDRPDPHAATRNFRFSGTVQWSCFADYRSGSS